MPEDKHSVSFWATLPGILSGAAAVLTAIASIAVVLRGSFANETSTFPMVTASSDQTATSPPDAKSIGAPPLPTTQGAIADRFSDPVVAKRLGREVSAETVAVGGGRMQDFEAGSIYWHPRAGAFAVTGAILEKYRAIGGTKFGYPTTDELPTPDGVGRFNHFLYFYPNGFAEGRSIYWRPDLGPHSVQGLVRAKWEESGWERGPLGYPTSDEYQAGALRRQDFEHGRIDWSIPTGARLILS